MASPAIDPIVRRPHSIRRTSSIDMHLGPDGLTLHGNARDLVTHGDSDTTVTSEASVTAAVDSTGVLTRLVAEPDRGDATRLVGVPVSSGFRRAVHHAYPDDVTTSTVTALLLDELPVATLISGYARLYSGDVPAAASRDGMQADICSGWRADGTMMRSVRAGAGVPVTVGPPAPDVREDLDNDPLGWHRIGSLAAGSMRRRRLVDVHIDGDQWSVYAMFRDTHRQVAGSETVLHEYTLAATVDATSRVFRTCSAVPRVLPWVECPVAAASAERLVGRDVDATRDVVRSDLRGTSTCTHLNDLLRSLGDVSALVHTLNNAHRDRQEFSG
jgi:hypothetical protein